MPLLRKDSFVPSKPDPGLKPTDEVFVCEATKEVFKDYEEFFQRTILCNSLVWSCSITGIGSIFVIYSFWDSAVTARQFRQAIFCCIWDKNNPVLICES